MAERRTGPQAPPPNGHEHTDANAVGMIKIGAGLLVLLAGVLAVAYGILRWMEVFPPEQTTQPSALANQNALPPEPRLQVAPPVDLMNYRQWEDSVLTTYGWVDQSRGTVRVPLDSAIAMVARKGLPVDPAAAAELRRASAAYNGRTGADTVEHASFRPLEPETSAPPGATTRAGTREASPRGADVSHVPGQNKK